MMTDTSSNGFAAAEAAYVTWQQEVKVRVEPLCEQDPEIQARWLRIADAARSISATGRRGDTGRAMPHTMTRFQAPLEEAEAAR